MIAVLDFLEAKSDWLSPIVVKEVRQTVRSREFVFSFGGSLVAALAVAFYGAANALGGSGTTGGRGDRGGEIGRTGADSRHGPVGAPLDPLRQGGDLPGLGRFY